MNYKIELVLVMLIVNEIVLYWKGWVILKIRYKF